MTQKRKRSGGSVGLADPGSGQSGNHPGLHLVQLLEVQNQGQRCCSSCVPNRTESKSGVALIVFDRLK